VFFNVPDSCLTQSGTVRILITAGHARSQYCHSVPPIAACQWVVYSILHTYSGYRFVRRNDRTRYAVRVTRCLNGCAECDTTHAKRLLDRTISTTLTINTRTKNFGYSQSGKLNPRTKKNHQRQCMYPQHCSSDQERNVSAMRTIIQSGADLEGGVGGQIRESGKRKSPSGVQGRRPGRRPGDGVPQKLEHF